MQRLRGNASGYDKLMPDLTELQARLEQDVRTALGNGELERARRLALHLGGVADNFGAYSRANAAGKLEHALAAQDGIEEALIVGRGPSMLRRQVQERRWRGGYKVFRQKLEGFRRVHTCASLAPP